MPKGPIGGPRPFSKYRLIINPHKRDVTLVKVGPFGGPRPFAKNNPPVTDERVKECVLSEAGRSFGAAAATGGGTTDIDELGPERSKEALEAAEAWCEGLLEATAMEESSEEDIERVTSDMKQALGVDEVQVADVVDEEVEEIEIE